MLSINHNLDLRNIKYTEHILNQNIHLFDNDDWYYISKYQFLSEPFITKYQHKLDWYYISACQSISFSFMKKYKYIIYWHRLFFNNYNIPIITKLLFAPYFNWEFICKL